MLQRRQPDGDFDDVGSADPEAAFTTYRQACADARAAAAGADPNDTFTDARRRCSVRWVYLHMIGEYARHNGTPTCSTSATTAPPGPDGLVPSRPRRLALEQCLGC